jgi:hypothetical protein
MADDLAELGRLGPAVTLIAAPLPMCPKWCASRGRQLKWREMAISRKGDNWSRELVAGGKPVGDGARAPGGERLKEQLTAQIPSYVESFKR